jgi:hypothetical protein
VAEPVLNESEIGPRLEEVRRGRVLEDVEVPLLRQESCARSILLDPLVERRRETRVPRRVRKRYGEVQLRVRK